eukprot:Selendium_serpulae@DN6243_c0_g1_i11.p1
MRVQSVGRWVLVKSAKMVPVVVGGFVLFRKKCPLYEYISVAIVTVSLILFNVEKIMKGGGHQTALGLILLFTSLILDGITGPNQDKLLAIHNLNSFQMMFFTNLFGALWSFICFEIFEGRHAAAFVLFCFVYKSSCRFDVLF